MNTTQKISTLITELSSGLFEREEALKLTLLSMIAGKSIFLYGPPGTAKSLIAKRASLAFGESKFFSYLLNRFSTPEEIFGPVDLSELKKGNLKRKTEGYLPTANFAFLDEIWKSSPAILNTLLTIINERIYRDGGENHKVPLQGIVCASNEFPPANQGLEALYDRMLLRVCVFPMQEKESFEKLLALSEGVEVTPSTTFSPQELEEVQKKAKGITFSSEALEVLHYVKATLCNPPKLNEEEEESSGIYVSDRRWQNIAQLLRVATLLSGREQVEKMDLMLLRHCLWESEEQREAIDEILKLAMKDVSLYDAQAIKKADMQWEEFEKKMHSLLYKSNGKPNLKIEQETLQNCLKQCEKLLETFEKTQSPAIKKKQLMQENFINPFLSSQNFDIALVDLTRFIQDIEQLKLKVEDMQSQIQEIQRLIEIDGKTEISKPKKTKTNKPHQPDSKAKLQSLIESGIPLGEIDTSLITDMSRLFADSPRQDFSGIEEWDTSNVENMSRMFENHKTFNHPISSWDTSSVEDMSYMFLNCEKFNQSLDGWDVSSVTTMSHMFENCSSFNQSLNEWDTSSVEDMEALFANCEKFNGQINKWNVSNVKKMNGMFCGCKIYNQPLGEWDVSNAVSMSSLFEECNFFNQPLEGWDVSNVVDMSFMFYRCYRFNRYICDWNVSNVKNMRYMFAGGYGDRMLFNQPIGKWDISSVEDMESMFGTGWSNCGNCFNQDLSSWQIDKTKCKTADMFEFCQIDSSNKPQGL